MIVPVAVGLVIGAVLLRHRSLDGLLDLRLAAPALAAGAIGAQVVLIELLPDDFPTWASRVIHVASYAAGLGFIWCNRRHVGLVVIGLGGVLNLAAIVANDGVMPASADAVERAGLEHGDGFENSAPVEDPELVVLGDVFAVPERWPLANVFSIGDVIVVVGAGVLVGRSARAARREVDGLVLS